MDKSIDVPERLALKGVNRRDFMKFCGFVATVLGLPMTFAPRIAEAVAAKRPTVVWLDGRMHRCTESLIRTSPPGPRIFSLTSLAPTRR
jgi:Ni,Fe-hydrogenase I small subunit